MVKHETSKQSYEDAQSGILSSDIFLSVEGKPVTVGPAPLETHKHVAEQVPSEVANIPFKGDEYFSDVHPEDIVVRDKNSRFMKALRLVFSYTPSNVVEYKHKDKTSPSHKREDTFSH